MRRSTLTFAVGGLFLLIVVGCATPAEEELPWRLENVFKRVPPLKHDAAGRLAMITWPPFVLGPEDTSFQRAEPLPELYYKGLAERGLAQKIPLKDNYIPMALAMQKAGGQVIIVEGWGGSGPGGLAKDPYHKLPQPVKDAAKNYVFPCPLLLDGWQMVADKTRETLVKFKQAGVKVDAVWLDWEVEPHPWEGQWLQSAACSRCRELFPRGVLTSAQSYAAFITRLRAELFSACIAAPVLEVYPGCSVTNWEAVFSARETPTVSCWGGWAYPPMDPGLMTATNPVAYGNNVFYSIHWKQEWGYPLDVAHMDRLYTRVMMSQASQDAENAQRLAPEKQCIPWVCRYCPDVEDERIPILSRERYREILRHLWLRGADSMQIFNHPRPGHLTIATEEIEDAVAVCDEMLAFREFLEGGRIMNTEVPGVQFDGAIWSGLALQKTAVVRAFTQGKDAVKFKTKPWEGGPEVELEAPPAGATYKLQMVGEGIKVEKQ
jgi:hypothetical protein